MDPLNRKLHFQSIIEFFLDQTSMMMLSLCTFFDLRRVNISLGIFCWLSNNKRIGIGNFALYRLHAHAVKELDLL